MSIKRSLKSDNRGLKLILLIVFFKSLSLFWTFASIFVKCLNWSVTKLPLFRSHVYSLSQTKFIGEGLVLAH